MPVNVTMSSSRRRRTTSSMRRRSASSPGLPFEAPTTVTRRSAPRSRVAATASRAAGIPFLARKAPAMSTFAGFSGRQGARPAGDAVQVHAETLDLQLRLGAAEARDGRRHERTFAEDEVGGREQLRVAAAPDRPGPRIHGHVVPVEGHDVGQPVAPGQRQVRPAAVPEVRVQDLRPVAPEGARVRARVEAHAARASRSAPPRRPGRRSCRAEKPGTGRGSRSTPPGRSPRPRARRGPA